MTNLGQVDDFAVHCPETRGVYVVPIDDVRTKGGAYLRVTPARNNQLRGARHAHRFQVASVAVASVTE